MRVFEHSDPASLAVRSHPWVGSLASPEHRYLDLRARPELIRTELEDLRPWAHTEAVERFYQLLEWVNGPLSILESNDCAFEGPVANPTPGVDMKLQCSGRLMLLFRHLPTNLAAAEVYGFTDRVARALSDLDPTLEWAAVGATIVPVRFTALPGAREVSEGHQLMLSLWAWGDVPTEALAHMHRTLGNLGSALRTATQPD